VSQAIWIDGGNEADYTRLKALGITQPVFDARDPLVNATHFKALIAQGFMPGVYSCWNWQPEVPKTGAGFAEWTSHKLDALPLGAREAWQPHPVGDAGTG
jgi:hypothetical protein